MYTKQSNNNATGDIAGRDIYKNITNHNYQSTQPLDELVLLYEKLKQDGIGDPSNNQFSLKLQHYMATPTDGDVRGLEEKLKDSARLDMLNLAISQKELTTKLIMKYQSSRTAQRVFTIILDELHTEHILTVVPVIQNDGDRTAVDHSTKLVLEKVRGLLGENLLELTVKDLLGFIYFLAGNCHIRWDKDANLSPSL